MNSQEFNALLVEHLYVALPSLEKWAKGLPNQQATLKLWRESLDDCTLDECVDVVRRWMRGELDPPEAFSRDLWPSRMRKAILADRKLSFAATQQTRHSDQKNQDATPLAPILAKAVAMRGRGVPAAEIREAIAALIPSQNDYYGPRYRCSQCQDRGLVEVWRADVVEQVDRNELPLESALGSYNVACCCESGRHHAAGNSRRGPMPVYSNKVFCRYRARALEIERAQMQKWLDARFQSRKNQDFVGFEGEPAGSLAEAKQL